MLLRLNWSLFINFHFYAIRFSHPCPLPLPCPTFTPPLSHLNPSLVPQEMLRDTVTNLLLLDPEEIARQITLKSFEVFKKIRPVEYVTDLFGLKSGYGQENIEVRRRCVWWFVCTYFSFMTQIMLFSVLYITVNG